MGGFLYPCVLPTVDCLLTWQSQGPTVTQLPDHWGQIREDLWEPQAEVRGLKKHEAVERQGG